VGHKTGLHEVVRRKKSQSPAGNRIPVIQPIVYSLTELRRFYMETYPILNQAYQMGQSHTKTTLLHVTNVKTYNSRLDSLKAMLLLYSCLCCVDLVITETSDLH